MHWSLYPKPEKIQDNQVREQLAEFSLPNTRPRSRESDDGRFISDIVEGAGNI